MKVIIKHTLVTAAILTAFTVVGTAMLAGTFKTTEAPILKNEREAKLELFSQVFPADLHDNDLLQDAINLPPTKELGQRNAFQIYRARSKGEPAGAIIEVIAPDGYSGEIKLLVGINAKVEVTGVRVLAHKETPGLGDYIDLAHGDWIKHFDNKSLGNTPDADWKVRKDGGQFDYMTGATITPRAVIKAVHKALVYFEREHDTIFAAVYDQPDNKPHGTVKPIS